MPVEYLLPTLPFILALEVCLPLLFLSFLTSKLPLQRPASLSPLPIPSAAATVSAAIPSLMQAGSCLLAEPSLQLQTASLALPHQPSPCNNLKGLRPPLMPAIFTSAT